MRRLALMGAAKGPSVSARGIRRPHLKVVGLPEKATLTVRTDRSPGVIIEANGVHYLDEEVLEWVEVSCHAEGKHMTVCEVISGKVA